MAIMSSIYNTIVNNYLDCIEIIFQIIVHVDDTMALRTLLDRMWMAAPSEIASATTELVLEQY